MVQRKSLELELRSKSCLEPIRMKSATYNEVISRQPTTVITRARANPKREAEKKMIVLV